MTTASNNTGLAHSTDADYRAWIAEFSAMLTAAGFPKSADTGQVDTATVTIPGTSTYNAYEIRYLNDSLHATKPCYIKIEFGTLSVAGRPAIRVSAASATDGAGALSGTTYLATSPLVFNGVIGAGPNFFSGACAVSGFAGFVWKRGATSASASAFFAVCRTADGTGAPTADGFNFYRTSDGTNGATALTRITYTTASFSDASTYALFPGANTNSLVSGGPQVMRHFTYTPEIRCVPFLVSYFNGENADLVPFTATPISTQITYLPLDGAMGPLSCGIGGASAGAVSAARIGMIWQ